MNLAARLCAQAEADQILLDDRVAAALPEDAVVSQGDIALKGLSSPVAVFALKETQPESNAEARAVTGEPLV